MENKEGKNLSKEKMGQTKNNSKTDLKPMRVKIALNVDGLIFQLKGIDFSDFFLKTQIYTVYNRSL